MVLSRKVRADKASRHNALTSQAQQIPLSLAVQGTTAINRTDLSRPVAQALADGLLDGSFFDFGCGRGTDVAGLVALGIAASGWDPVHAPTNSLARASVVNLGFVVNVIEDPAERSRTLRAAWGLAERTMIVSARLDWERSAKLGVPHGDGILTARGTFQRYFSHEELRAWIDSTLQVESVAASPGVFYVFRTEAVRQQFAASQFVHRPRAPRLSPSLLFEGHRNLLEPLVEFLEQRGRLPSSEELSNFRELHATFGSIERAYRILSRALGTTTWEEAALRRQRDLLVYVALSRFGRRPKFSDLPDELRKDVKALFGSYTATCRLGDALLFSCGHRPAIDAECRASTIGKTTPDALYVHVSALAELSPLLRTYEGCARTLMGVVDGVTLIKLRRDKPKVSYLVYEDFDTCGHPALRATFVADLVKLRTYHRDYSQFSNRPVLHRKETFVASSYPLRPEFEALTAAEDAASLLDNPETIGFAEHWQARLASRGYEVKGNRLVRHGEAAIPTATRCLAPMDSNNDR